MMLPAARASIFLSGRSLRNNTVSVPPPNLSKNVLLFLHSNSVIASLHQGSVDIQDAYLYPHHSSSTVISYTSLIIGFSTATSVFTKVLAPVLALLHSCGDPLLFSGTWAPMNVKITVQLLMNRMDPEPTETV